MSPSRNGDAPRHEGLEKLTAGGWLRSPPGLLALKKRAQKAARFFLEEKLEDRLHREREACRAGGNKLFRFANSLRLLNEEMMVLALAHQEDSSWIGEEAWHVARRVWALTLGLDSMVFHRGLHRQSWKSDLYTADLGLSMAFTGSLDTPLETDGGELRDFLETRCWIPIAEDWLDGATRIHSLDSMGHNWWSVIVGGAGVMARLAGWKDRAAEAATRLQEWFRYPGNEAFRKQPNFSSRGDYVEGFAYGEYALMYPFTLAFLLPECRIIPDWLSIEQGMGLADWYKNAFIKTRDGYWPKRFGDISLAYQPNAVVWHTLARLTGDQELLTMAHQIRPDPRRALEFLLWEPLSPGAQAAAKPRAKSVRVFPVSGTAFLGGESFAVSVRAGEFWNHNHLDAGSFIFSQNEAVWIDDAGTCKYSSADYDSYYVLPQAHNVAYAPDLMPFEPKNRHSGASLAGHFLSHARVPGFEALHADTRILSSGRLAHSSRRFFVLNNEVLVIWDDLEAYENRSFQFLLHTACHPAEGSSRLVSGDGQHCPFAFFSDSPCSFATAPAMMGDIPPENISAPADPVGTLQGTRLLWQSERPMQRQKFGLVMGQGLQSARWTALESGWECSIVTGAARWLLWLNRATDERAAPARTTRTWRGFHTDACALFLQEKEEVQSLTGLDASFIRTETDVIHDTLHRQPVAGFAARAGKSDRSIFCTVSSRD